MNYPSPEFERALAEVIDGSVSEETAAALNLVLSTSAEARVAYVTAVELHGELACRPDLDPLEAAEPAPRPSPLRMPRRALLPLAAAAAVALALGGLWLGNRGVTRSAETIGTIVSAQGTVRWMGGEGPATAIDGSEQALRAGTYVLRGDLSTMEVRLDDGSMMRLGGDSEFHFARESSGSVFLNLVHGYLMASVLPTLTGSSLIVTTPTARADFAGSVDPAMFEIDSRAGETLVALTRGTIPIVRLSDQIVQTLRSREYCVVGAENGPITPREFHLPPEIWSPDFSDRPEGHWTAAWLPPTDSLPGRMAAVIRPGDERGPHFRVMNWSRAGGFVSLTESSRVRFRFRAEEAVPMELFMSTRREDGDFGGNYTYRFDPASLPADEDGWRELVVSLDQLAVQREDHLPSPPVPGMVHGLFVSTINHDVGLEVAEISIQPAPES